MSAATAVTETAKEVVSTPKQWFTWAKAKPWALVAGVLILAFALFRYRNSILRWLTGIKFLGIGSKLASVLRVGPAAAALFVACAGLRALCSSLGFDLPDVEVPTLLVGSVFFPKEDTLDLLTTDGDTTTSMTPTTSEVLRTFLVASPTGGHAGAFIKVTGFPMKLVVGLDQPAAGGSVVNWDQIPRVIAGVEIVHPLWKTILPKEAGSGPILKHIIEFIGSGFQYAGDGPRAQIAAADGDTAMTLYVTYPLAQRYLVRPHDTAFWIGLLDGTRIAFSLGTTTSLDAVSTGAVIETTCNLQMGADYVLDNDAEIPSLPYWHRFDQNAGGPNIVVKGLGLAGPHETRKSVRIAGMYELMDVAGMGGPDGADNITRILFAQKGLDRVVNVDFLVKNQVKVLRPGALIQGGVGASTPLHALAGNPYTMSATPNGALNDANLMYLALHMPGRQQEITKMWKGLGDFTITQEYTSTPASGQHRIVSQEIREFTPAMVGALKAKMGKEYAGRSHDFVFADDAKKVGDASSGLRPSQVRGLPRKLK